MGYRKFFPCFTALIMTFALLAPAANANSAEPPGFTIVVPSAPADLSLSVVFSNGDRVVLRKESRIGESYFYYYYWLENAHRTSLEQAVLEVETAQIRYQIGLSSLRGEKYNEQLTLNLVTQTLSWGYSPMRQALWVILRITLTLAVETLIFWAFGYRTRQSWLTFLAVNLLTQGGLNWTLSQSGSGSYWIFAFGMLESIIFITEAIIMAFFLREHSRKRAVLCSLSANLASLLAGIALLSHLPL
jgi:hypothetical protein